MRIGRLTGRNLQQMTIAERMPLTRARVVAGALELIDTRGVESLSMRKLGQQLGVEAMSLYNHVTSKADLLDAVASHLLELVEVPDTDAGDWRAHARTIAENVRAVGLAHPRAFGLLASRKLSSFAAWSPVLGGFALGKRAGLSAAESVTLVAAMSGFIVGYVLLEIGADEPDGGHLTPGEVPPDQPLLREYVEIRSGTSFDRQYRAAIDLIIAGIEAKLEAARSGRSAP